jgi:hypothetical protein
MAVLVSIRGRVGSFDPDQATCYKEQENPLIVTQQSDTEGGRLGFLHTRLSVHFSRVATCHPVYGLST